MNGDNWALAACPLSAPHRCSETAKIGGFATGRFRDRIVAYCFGCAIQMSMDVMPKQVSRREALLACVIVALAAVVSFLLGHVERPSASTGKVLLLARILTPHPLFSHMRPMSKISDIMVKNDVHLGEISRQTLFEVAYDCKIDNFVWEPLPVNHWPSFNEILEVPLDSLTERQSRCISRIIIPPNVATAIAPKSDLTNAVQRMTDRDPFEGWY